MGKEGFIIGIYIYKEEFERGSVCVIVSQLTITLYLYVVKGFVFSKIINTTQIYRIFVESQCG